MQLFERRPSQIPALLTCIVIFSTSVVGPSLAWSLANLGLSPADYRIEHASVFYVRAFLCLRATQNHSAVVHIPTLVEVPWPEPLQLSAPRPVFLHPTPALFAAVNGHHSAAATAAARIFPSDLDHAPLHNARKCNSIIAARATAVDMHGGDLWVLDGGSAFCAPKLIEYDLVGGGGGLPTNAETHRQTLGGLAGRLVASVHVEPPPASSASTTEQTTTTTVTNCHYSSSKRLVVTLDDVDADFLVVYEIRERRWWKLKLITSHNRIVVPHSVAFRTTGQLYVADRADHLWLVSTLQSPDRIDDKSTRTLLPLCRHRRPPSAVRQQRARFVADLLGHTGRTLTVDPADQRLYYDLPRDGAVVRWDTRRSLRAESHDVLHFGRRRVAQIVFGYHGAVWVVSERPTAAGEHCERILGHFSDTATSIMPIIMQPMSVAGGVIRVRKRHTLLSSKWQ